MNRALVRLEGLSVLVGALVLYWMMGGPWIWLPVLFFLPDLAMIGYVAGNRVGAITYNTVHTYLVPLVALGAGYLLEHRWLILVGLVWAAHIGMDRALGYGLKYSTGFKDTHISHI